MTDTATLETMPLGDLYQTQAHVADKLTLVKSEAATIAAELHRRFAASVKQALEQAGKTHGTMTLPLQDGLAIKTDTKQTVSWDSDALMAIAQGLPWERAAALFSIKFSMSETIYKGIAAAAPELREKVDAARTTKVGEPVVTLVKEG